MEIFLFTTPQMRVCTLEGESALDMTRDSSTVPWYYDGLRIRCYLKVAADALLVNEDFEFNDTPAIVVTDVMRLWIYLDDVDRFDLEIVFGLYFAVRTVQNRNESGSIYTQRGSAWWIFDGSGWFAGSFVWNPYGGTKNYGSSSFMVKHDGSKVPMTTRPTMYDIIDAGISWTTEDQ